MIFVVGALVVVALVAVVLAARSRRVAMSAAGAERRLRSIALQAPELAMVLVDREHRIVVAEGMPFERSDVPVQRFLGRPLGEVVPGDRLAPFRARVDEALAGASGAFDHWGELTQTVYRVHYAPFVDGGETYAALAMRDVSAEQELQRSLESQRRFLAAVFAKLGDRVRVADADGRLLTFDGTTADDELHPLQWAGHFGFTHGDGRPFGPHETPLLRALRGEQVEGVEVHVGERTLLESGGPVLGTDGEQIGAVVVTTDLTDYRNAEGRLRRSEERHRRVVETVSDCVFETDASGRWTYLSDAWTTATGFPVEVSLGRGSWEFVHPEDRTPHIHAFAPLLGGERAALRHEHRFVTAAGAERWAEVQVRAISGWDGLPTGFVGVMRDVTDERRAQQHVAAEQAVMRHLTGMSGLDDSGAGLVEIIGRELGWDGAELWRMAGDERLRRFAAWTAPGVAFEQFMASGERLAYEVGDGFPGMTWMSRAPLWKSEIEGDKVLVRLGEALADGIRSTVALPIRADGEPVGVVVLVSRTPREPEAGINRLLEALGGQVTQFLQRREAEGQAAAQAADLRRLSEVAHELAGENDLFAARSALCRAVRDVTGSAMVALLEPSGEDALAVSAAIGTAVRGLDVELDPRSITAEAFLSRRMLFVADVAGDSRAVRCQAVGDAVSAAWVPVVRDDQSVGVLAVGWAAHRPDLPSRDEELLRLLAAEAAITIHRTDLLARLQSTARTDPLTGLPNRRVWDEDLAREIARSRRHGGTLCLAMLDLDKFKNYNDTNGHQAGDELLAGAAEAWRHELRSTDTIARFGGEEFAVLLPHSDEEGAVAVIERLLAVVPCGQTSSAGIAVWDGAESGDALLARADAALYAAKHAGRARALVSKGV